MKLCWIHYGASVASNFQVHFADEHQLRWSLNSRFLSFKHKDLDDFIFEMNWFESMFIPFINTSNIITSNLHMIFHHDRQWNCIICLLIEHFTLIPKLKYYNPVFFVLHRSCHILLIPFDYYWQYSFVISNAIGCHLFYM